MNRRVAKGLRRFAIEKTMGMVERQLMFKDEKSMTVVNHPGTTRAIYQDLKAQYKGQKHGK